MTSADYKDELDNLIYQYYNQTGNLITKDILEQILSLILKYVYLDNNEKGADSNE